MFSSSNLDHHFVPEPTIDKNLSKTSRLTTDKSVEIWSKRSNLESTILRVKLNFQNKHPTYDRQLKHCHANGDHAVGKLPKSHNAEKLIGTLGKPATAKLCVGTSGCARGARTTIPKFI
jgi:hypothetical protein